MFYIVVFIDLGAVGMNKKEKFDFNRDVLVCQVDQMSVVLDSFMLTWRN